ncbi:MAG TPA: bifunctional nuclease family protein [Bacteroidales bacterium]|jgi:bifunctional DNase/RNase|nr:bifunctional nuclease family protein [Bacteroidales bacterium]HPS71149.1 bifunctional nuclease family protein [Bacteroidales bacterium]
MATYIELEIVDVQNSQTPNDAYVLLLKEKLGERILPIVIGLSEAKTIVLVLNKVTSRRPTTHELFKNFSDLLGYKVVKVQIEKFEEGIYYSNLYLTNGDETIILDARTSDAVAITMLSGAQLFVESSIIEEVSIVPSKYSENEIFNNDDEEADNQEYDLFIDSRIKEMTDEELETLLQGAIESEDFELASKIHEEMEKRK